MGLNYHGKRIPGNILAIRYYEHWKFAMQFELEVNFLVDGTVEIRDGQGGEWHERYFMMTAWFNQYYPEIVDDLQAEPIKDFPMEWPADMLAPAHSKNDEPGMVLCDKHGYYWWEDGCIACQNGD